MILRDVLHQKIADIIILDPETVTDECPYEVLLRVYLLIDEKDVLIDEKDSLLFRMTNQDCIECMKKYHRQNVLNKIPVFTTAEDFLISNHFFCNSRNS